MPQCQGLWTMRSAVTAGSAYVRTPLLVPQNRPARVQNTLCERQQKYIPACAILRLRMELSPPHGSSQMWKLTLAYDGTDFHGWQVQPGLPTIQGELAAAIERVCGERTLPQGSGRTDTGVHALAQVASVALASPIPPANLQRALNRTLPAAIRVLEAAHAPPDFHARHSATAKRYEYRIFRGEICPPHLARYVYAMPKPLDIAAMQHAAALVVGTHDFSAFAACDPDRTTRMAETSEVDNVRTLTHSAWHQDGDLLIYTVRGNGFLHHMVRNLVGTFLEVGRGRRRVAAIPELVASRNRMAAGATAPARGLFLHSVFYADSSATLS
jgi:tRNA pseudouridine38-40 synthase